MRVRWNECTGIEDGGNHDEIQQQMSEHARIAIGNKIGKLLMLASNQWK
jgi:hypothetical protein